MTTQTEVHDREALAVAIGSLRLEGIEPDAEALADMERVVSGKMTTDDAIKNILDRVRREQVQHHA